MSWGHIALSLPPKFKTLLLLTMNKVVAAGAREPLPCGRESIDAAQENENGGKLLLPERPCVII